ncbi:ChbG/HpnK family deacetylase [Methylobacterium oryzihabitans]|uniref:ChbG/HpnK family deacetylase n=1 Tax=Methylobacterium oryzihabitans TaxID=2499852 RepID=A0A3S3U5K8_9HYPH|nr:ChbG/HpnK family deacetylase [Methylobacterium oryzihabitans]RVU16147.1 ChbG/HpnK family deacetylase [Methylobacterium oryzihabitans]
MSPERRPIVLCADDFGLGDGVNRGILRLARAGRLSATGSMTNLPGFRRGAPALKELAGTVGLGLHLTLTAGAPLGPMPRLAPDGRLPSLGRLMALSLSGRLDRAEILAEIARQCDAFTAAVGRPPDFVDGHQHVHVLPGIRGALLAVLAERRLSGRIWLRDPSDRPGVLLARPSAPKAALVAGLAAGFAAAAARAGFPTNRGFSGFSDFAPGGSVPDAFERAFARPGPAPVVMCHPGEVDDEVRALDPVVESRPLELAYLASPRFPEFLARERFRLVARPF